MAIHRRMKFGLEATCKVAWNDYIYARRRRCGAEVVLDSGICRHHWRETFIHGPVIPARRS
jgi:hypothetical protein